LPGLRERTDAGRQCEAAAEDLTAERVSFSKGLRFTNP
jgi:hypothetical protein